MTEIKGIETYIRFAEEFAREQWGRAFDLPLEMKRSRSRDSGWFSYFPARHYDEGAEKIVLNLSRIESHEEAIELLKHELCHWHCYTSGMQHEDGTVDFERTLMESGAVSTTNGYMDKDKSRFLQASVIDGTLGRSGLSGTEYIKVTRGEIEALMEERDHPMYTKGYIDCGSMPSAYEVYHDGEFICHTFKFEGLWHILEGMPGVPGLKGDDIYLYGYSTRKDAVLQVLLDGRGIHERV